MYTYNNIRLVLRCNFFTQERGTIGPRNAPLEDTHTQKDDIRAIALWDAPDVITDSMFQNKTCPVLDFTS